MDISHTIILALIQGFSEFLPISSSAHLVLVPEFLGWVDQGLAFDVALHLGTLLAILFYFKDNLVSYVCDFVASLKNRQMIGKSRVVYAVLIATIPVGVAGLLFGSYVEQFARNYMVIAITSIIFALFLWYADVKRKDLNLDDVSIKLAFLIGLAQMIAIIPGVSRSGITMSMALLLGFSQNASANFSFLLSIPVIILAGGYEFLKLLKSDELLQVSWGQMGLGVAVSAISAYVCVKLFMAIIARLSFLPFVIYRLALGVFLLLYFG